MEQSSQREPLFLHSTLFSRGIDNVAHILESREEREIILISFPLKHALDV